MDPANQKSRGTGSVMPPAFTSAVQEKKVLLQFWAKHSLRSVLIHEALHEIGELLNALNWHTVVDGCSASSNRPVASQCVQLHFLRILEELLCEISVITLD